MTSYLYFIGIDIAKDFFEVAFYVQNMQQKSEKNSYQFTNTVQGFEEFMQLLDKNITQYFITLEATGGYEHNLLLFLCKQGIAVHRLQTLKASHYIKSLQSFGKTDELDAKALARYGYERHESLSLFILPSETMMILTQLSMRRTDLVTMLVAEKQRLKHPNYTHIKDSVKEHCVFLQNEITHLEQMITDVINKDAQLVQKKKILTAFKGIGEHTSHVLITHCPELGTLNRRQIASLAGVAPHPKQSGQYMGYRSTKGGRAVLKRALFMVALSAKSYNVQLKTYYDRLIARGKKKMVALTAVMRKIIVILNAKLRDATITQ